MDFYPWLFYLMRNLMSILGNNANKVIIFHKNKLLYE